MILDASGNAIALNESRASGGWFEQTAILNNGFNSTAQSFNRTLARRKARIFFYTNYLIGGALDITHGFLIGNDFNYADSEDDTLNNAIREFWDANNFMDLLERYFYEFNVDGENLTIFPQRQAGKNAPSILNFIDVDKGLELDFDFNVGAVKSIKVEHLDRVFNQSNSVWTAHKAFFNDPRGVPVIMTAVDSAESYINLLGSRVKMHDIQSRINGIYKAFISPELTSERANQILSAKAARFSAVPRNGSVLTLAKDPTSGMSEDFEFTRGQTGTSDVIQDAKLFALGVCISLNIPLHWIYSDSSVATRASSEAISEGAKRVMMKKQAKIRSWLDKVFAIELCRRLGPNYIVKAKTGNQVLIKNYRVPWQFPALSMQGLMETVGEVDFGLKNGLISRSTASVKMGLDFDIEQTLIKSEAKNA